MTYVAKPYEIEAIKLGTDEFTTVFEHAVTNGIILIIPQAEGEESALVTTKAGAREAAFGDYITYLDGKFDVFTAAVFESRFEIPG